jgi:hypothetical protein
MSHLPPDAHVLDAFESKAFSVRAITVDSALRGWGGCLDENAFCLECTRSCRCAVRRRRRAGTPLDNEKERTLEGTVKEFQWTNPHAWIQLMVKGPDGKTTEWSIECASPNGLKRQGWRAASIKAGDKVTAIIHPLKNGDSGGSLVIVTLPDGKTLGRRGPPPKEGEPQ